MPPKGNKSGGGGVLAEAGGEPDKTLQAVVIADGDYSSRFQPLTLETPRVSVWTFKVSSYLKGREGEGTVLSVP